jgi:glutathione S-transferase
MLKIYGVLRSRATRNVWLANELGVPFEHIPVIQVYRLPKPDAPGAPFHTRSPDFVKVNPNAQIPVAVDENGVHTESLAINLYLAKKHGGPLGPANVVEDGQMTQWTLWAATSVENDAITILYNRIGKPPAERDEKLALAAIEALRPKFAVLEKHLAANGGFIVGKRFTVADVNLAEIFRYAQPAPVLFDAAPHVKAWLSACQARPHFKAMMAKREAEPA